MLIMMFMLMMLMMMKLEQVPTFFAQTQRCSHFVDQWMDHSQSAVSRTSLSTACRMLRESVSRTMLSTECLNAEPFTWGPQCLPCVESSNVLLDEVLTKGSGHPWTE